MAAREARIVLAALALLALPGSAHADEPAPTEAQKEARALFNQALEQANSGDARGALTTFRSAYERYPSFRVLYNIGQLCIRLADNACTVRAYEQYLRDGGADVPAARRTEVESELRARSRKIATLSVTSNVAGAEVRIDDELVGRTPLPRPIAINAGAHVVSLTHEDKKVERSLKVEGIGESATVDLLVSKESQATAKAPEAATKPTPAPARRPVPIIPWAVTGGFAVATAVTGVLAASSYSSFKDTRDTFGITRQELDDSQSSARTLLLVTAVLGTITVASAGVATYFTFFAPPPAPPTTPRVGIGPRGVVLEVALP